MSNLNLVQLIGRVGNIELKYTPSSTPVCNISLATTEKWKDKSGQDQERTEWSKCTIYGKGAEILNQYASKGSLLYLAGKLNTRSWDKDGETRYTTEIIIKDFKFLSSNKKGSSPGQDNNESTVSPEDVGYSVDDLPF